MHLKYSFIKNMHFKYSFIKNMQIGVPQIFSEPIQKRASSRSVQLEAVLLKALL